MSTVLLPVVLVACCMLVAFGVVRLFAWTLDQRDAALYRAFRERQIVAWAETEAAVIECERSLQEAQRRG